MRQNAHLSVDGKGLTEADDDDEAYWAGVRDEPATPALWDEMADALLTSVDLLKDGTPFSLGLSGGRDSRLVAAALTRQGMPYVASSSGFSDSADVILGQRISDLLEVPNRLM